MILASEQSTPPINVVDWVMAHGYPYPAAV